MALSNFHTHTEFCDGKSCAEEMTERAVELGFSELGFSSHSPLDGEDWCLTPENFAKYADTVLSLKERYCEKTKIFLGIEQDFMSEKINLPFEYIIGSVHSVETHDGERFVDISLDGVLETIDKYFGGDAYTYAEAYYDRVGYVVAKTGCDIIGHFDLVTKYIEKVPYLSEDHPRYIAAQDKALDKLLSTNAVFEVNTGAIARGHRTTPYPNARVLQRLREAGKAVVVNSDCHHKDKLDMGIVRATRMMESLSITTLTTLDEILAISRK